MNREHTADLDCYVPPWRYLQYARGPQQPGSQQQAPHRVPSPISTNPLGQMALDIRGYTPPNLPRDPRVWTREDVSSWLRWCQEEFDLPSVNVVKFPMNGKALCLLHKQDFNERAPMSGDVLYNAFQLHLKEALAGDVSLLARRNNLQRQIQRFYNLSSSVQNTSGSVNSDILSAWPIISCDYHNLGQLIQQATGENGTNGLSGADQTAESSTVTLSPAPSNDSHSESPRTLEGMNGSSYSNGAHHKNGNENGHNGRRSRSNSESEESNCDYSTLPTSVPHRTTVTANNKKTAIPSPDNEAASFENAEPIQTSGRLLWDFLHQLLNDPSQRYTGYIAWKDRPRGMFKIVDPPGLARLWGLQKNHLNMNFDKMSRALRYYYRVNILKKVQGERHCYQFLRQPMELRAFKQRSFLHNLAPSADELETPIDLSEESRVAQLIMNCKATDPIIKTEPGQNGDIADK